MESLNELPIKWVIPDKAIAQKAGLLRQLYSGLKTPDAIHLATAIAAKADRFVTNDQVIMSIKEIDGTLISALK